MVNLYNALLYNQKWVSNFIQDVKHNIKEEVIDFFEVGEGVLCQILSIEVQIKLLREYNMTPETFWNIVDVNFDNLIVL